MTTENKNEQTMKPDASATTPVENKSGEHKVAENKPGDTRPGQGAGGDKRPSQHQGQQQGQPQGQKPATTKS